MQKIVGISIFLICFISSQITLAQNPNASPFIEISYVKSKPGFDGAEKESWRPLQQQLIKEGKLVAWYLYKTQYPEGTKKEYDYVSVNVYKNWAQVENSGMTDVDKKVNQKVREISELVWKELLQLSGQAVEKEKIPSQYIIVNQMKVVPGQEGEYVKLELTYFKPFHTARAELEIMNNWGLYKRNQPYGEKYEYDYVTFNGYAEWADIVKNNPPDAWKKVHGDTNFNDVHDKILSKRSTVNNELWRLVDHIQ